MKTEPIMHGLVEVNDHAVDIHLFASSQELSEKMWALIQGRNGRSDNPKPMPKRVQDLEDEWAEFIVAEAEDGSTYSRFAADRMPTVGNPVLC